MPALYLLHRRIPRKLLRGAIITDIKDTTMQDCFSSVEQHPLHLSTVKHVRCAEMKNTGSQPSSEASTHRRPISSSSLAELHEHLSRTERKIAAAAKLELQHLTRAKQVRHKWYRWAKSYERLMQDLHERRCRSTGDAKVVYTRMEMPPTFPVEMKSSI
jgi:hypothetical protein